MALQGFELNRISGKTSTLTKHNKEVLTKGSSPKPEKKLRRTEEKLEYKPKKKLRRTEEKLEKINKVFFKTEEELENKPKNEVEKKLRRTEEELEKKSHFTQLVGGQRKIMISIFLECYKTGSLTTPPLTIEFLSKSSQVPAISIRKSVQILESKHYLARTEFKNGRGGWTKYCVKEKLYAEMLQLKSEEQLEKNMRRSEEQLEYKLENKPENIMSSSNSSINNTITTKKDENWLREIQTPENLKNLGLGVNHIRQLKDKFSLSPEQIQQGIEAFSYDLGNGELERLKKRGIQNMIGYFFGAMKNGGYNSVKEDFVTAEDLAENEMLQRLKKIKNERLERKEKLEELLFSEWLETKSKEDLLMIESPLVDYMDSFHKSALKGYFLENKLAEFQKGFK